MCLSDHPSRFLKLRWESLYVALSRIRKRDDMRLLLLNGDRNTMSYISELQKDKCIQNFFEGYVPQGKDNFSPVVWDSNRACKAAGII